MSFSVPRAMKSTVRLQNRACNLSDDYGFGELCPTAVGDPPSFHGSAVDQLLEERFHLRVLAVQFCPSVVVNVVTRDHLVLREVRLIGLREVLQVVARRVVVERAHFSGLPMS